MKAKFAIPSWGVLALGAVVLTGCNSHPKDLAEYWTVK